MPLPPAQDEPHHLAPNPRGLSEAAAAQRLSADGPNEIEPVGRHTLWNAFVDVAGDPMFLLLFAAGALYAAVGDLGEAALLVGFVVLIVLVTVAQAQRTSHVLEALRAYSQPRVQVWRDGTLRSLATRDIVVGDEIVLSEGDRVAADGLLLEAHELSIDESTLSGESVAVRKRAMRAGESMGRPGGDDTPCAWAGTLVVQGQGVLRVCATGTRTEFGALGHVLQHTQAAPSPLQMEMRQVVKRFAALGVAISVATVALYGLLHANWVAALLAGIALAMSLLPQEFPVILTMFQALGARRLAQRGVLVRRLSAIELLGETTVLCVDKTGTLTENKMRVAALVPAKGSAWRAQADGGFDLPTSVRDVLTTALLASETSPHDAMEQAIHELAARALTAAERPAVGWAIAHEYALAPDFLAMTHVWQRSGEDGYTLAAKGSPEAIADLCHLDDQQTQTVMHDTAELAAQGLRVLGVARGVYRGAQWASIQHEMDYEFMGLLALADPLRAEVPSSIAACRAAGVRVVMITGDYATTAQAIAQQAGLRHQRVLSGTEVSLMDDAQLDAAAREVDVFARLMPEHKLRLVRALTRAGEVVTMTGDGVNDAPALAAAHIGVAMAQRGSQPAREASALLLLRDSFADLVNAIALGRRIYDNLVRSMRYVVAVHLPIAGLTLLPLVLGLYGMRLATILQPAHVAFLELVIGPICSIVFEAEPAAQDLMLRPARQSSVRLMNVGLLLSAVAQGALAFGCAAAVWALALRQGLGTEAARGLCFASVVLSDLSLVLSNQTATVRRSMHRMRMWLTVSILSLAALGLALFFPPLMRLFGFAAFEPAWLLAPLVAATIAGLLSRLLAR